MNCITVAIALLSAVQLAGCTTLASSYEASSIPSAPSSLDGVAYSLPMAKLRIVLVRDASGIAVAVGKPDYIPDPKASYLFSYRPSISAVDKLKIEVDGRGLLTAVGGEADDQSGAIIAAVAKLFVGVPEAALSGGGETLFDTVFDPADQTARETAASQLNQALARRLLPLLQRDCTDAVDAAANPADLPKDSKERAARVRELTERAIRLTPACRATSRFVPPTITMAIQYAPFKFAGGRPAPCTVGFCARKLSPATITFALDGIPFASEQFLLPNGSDPVPYGLRRAAFAKATYAVKLQDGMILSSEINKGSELLAIANVPLEIVKGVFATAAELVQLRINLTNNEKALATAQQERLEAEDLLKDAREASRVGAAEGSLDADLTLVRAYIPGLGAGSGAGSPSGTPIENVADGKPAAAGGVPGQSSAAVGGGAQGPAQAGGGAADAGSQTARPGSPEAEMGVDAGTPLGPFVHGGNDGGVS